MTEARKRGYSLLQLEGLAKAQGASIEDLSLLRTAWNDSKSALEDLDKVQDVQEEEPLMFGNELEMFDEELESDIFGSAFLQIKTLQKPHSFM